MKSNNYREELEVLQEEKYFLVYATVGKKSTKHMENMFGGYKLRTVCLTDVKCGTVDGKKVTVVAKTDHLWICESDNTVARDKNINEGDVIVFKARVKEYNYSHGARQLGVVQYGKDHRNMTQNYNIGYKK